MPRQNPEPVKAITKWARQRPNETDDHLSPSRRADAARLHEESTISGKITGFNSQMTVIPDLYLSDGSEYGPPNAEPLCSMGPTIEIRQIDEPRKDARRADARLPDERKPAKSNSRHTYRQVQLRRTTTPTGGPASQCACARV